MTTQRLMNELRQQLDGSAAATRRRPLPTEPARKKTPAAPTVSPAAPPKRSRDTLQSRQAKTTLDALELRPVAKPALLEQLKTSTPAKIGVGRAGLRYRTQTLLQFLTDFAVAKAAVESQIPTRWPEEHGYLALQTAAANAEEFLTRPDLGRRLSPASLELLRTRGQQHPEVQIVIGDGLSAAAVEQNAPPMVQTLVQQLEQQGLAVGTLVFVRHCRAKIIDQVGQVLGAKVGVILVGERPGLGTGDGMSTYLVWEPREARTDAEKQAISNIHPRGLLPEEAGLHAARVIEAILQQETSGVRLDLSHLPPPQRERPRVNQAHSEPLLGCGQSHGQQCVNRQHDRPGSVCGRSETRPCEVGSH